MRKYITPPWTTDTFLGTLWLRLKMGLYLSLGVALIGTAAVTLPAWFFLAVVIGLVAGLLIGVLLHGKIVLLLPWLEYTADKIRRRHENARNLVGRIESLLEQVKKIAPSKEALPTASPEDLKKIERLFEEINELIFEAKAESKVAQDASRQAMQFLSEWKQYRQELEQIVQPNRTPPALGLKP